MSNDLVSVVLPVYNTEEYLEKAIDSVASQNYKYIEIIVVDDASPKATKALYERITTKYSEIKVIHHEINQGIVGARNTGIKNACGEWIMFLDSDDIIYPETISRLVESAKSHNTVLSLGSFSRNVNGNVCVEFQNELDEGKYSIPEFMGLIINKVPLNVVSCIGTKLYKLDYLKSNNIWFQHRNKYNEDLAFVIDVMKDATAISYIDVPVYEYYIRNSGSIQSSNRPELFPYLYSTRIKLEELIVRTNNMVKQRVYLNNMWLDVCFICLLEDYKYNNSIDASFLHITQAAGVMEWIKKAKPSSITKKIVKMLIGTQNKKIIESMMKVIIIVKGKR